MFDAYQRGEMMENKFKNASWIWDPRFLEEENLYLDFSETLQLTDVTEPYTIYISADSNYALYVNEKLVSFGQYADYENYKIYDTVSLDGYLHSGENHLLITVLYKGKDSFVYRKGAPGLIYALYARDNEILVSRPGVPVSKNQHYYSGPIENVTAQIGASVEYSSNDIQQPICGDSIIVEKNRVLYPRPIKKLVTGDVMPAAICAQGVFRTGEGEKITRGEKMFRSYLSARRLGELTGNWKSVKLPIMTGLAFHLGEFDADGIYIVLDLEKESTGIFTLDIELPESAEIEVGYGEHLIDLRPRSYIGARNFMFLVHGSKGRNRIQIPFLRLGLRYLQLNIHVSSFTLYYAGICPTEYPVNMEPYFKCRDHLHNRIYETCVRTLHSCMHEHYEDCPWREQALYAMDSRNQMLCGYYTFGEFTFARESLRLMAYGIREDGMLDLCFPSRYARTIPSFTAIYPVQLEEYLRYSGDVTFISEVLPVAEKILETFLTARTSIGLIPRWHDNTRYWNFYEWQTGLDNGLSTDPDKEIYDAPCNAFVSIALNAMILLEKAVGAEKKAEYYRSQKEMLDEKIRQSFWNAEMGVYASHLEDGTISHYAELTNALLVYGDICTLSEQNSILEALINKQLIPITLSHSIFKYEALLRQPERYARLVFDEIAVKWGEMLYEGATTFYETEDGAAAFGGAGSLCHGWSAIPSYLYFAYVLGLKPIENGYKRYQIQRIDCGIPDAEGLAIIPDGEIILKS